MSDVHTLISELLPPTTTNPEFIANPKSVPINVKLDVPVDGKLNVFTLLSPGVSVDHANEVLPVDIPNVNEIRRDLIILLDILHLAEVSDVHSVLSQLVDPDEVFEVKNRLPKLAPNKDIL